MGQPISATGRWLALAAALLGWMFDGLEMGLFPLVARPALRELLGPGLTVRIGSENSVADLLECSLVLAPYLVEGEVAGTVGVLGPTRMDYRKAQAAVSTVSQQLGKQLSR